MARSVSQLWHLISDIDERAFDFLDIESASHELTLDSHWSNSTQAFGWQLLRRER